MKSGTRRSKHKRASASSAPAPTARKNHTRKGKLSGGIIALSSAAIVAIYSLGRANTSAGSEQAFVDAPTAQAGASVRSGSTPAPAPTQVPATQAAAYKDGSYVGNGNSRHGGMQVTVVIKDGKIASANVTSCGTRYPCSDVNSLARAAVSKQTVPTNHVSGSTDSSQAYEQALTNALKQAKA